MVTIVAIRIHELVSRMSGSLVELEIVKADYTDLSFGMVVTFFGSERREIRIVPQRHNFNFLDVDRLTRNVWAGFKREVAKYVKETISLANRLDGVITPVSPDPEEPDPGSTHTVTKRIDSK